MDIPDIFPCEYQFCLILWEYEPILSTELVSICHDELHWSKSTTYTVIRRLVSRGIMQNKQAMCTSIISREQGERCLIQKFAERYFRGDYHKIEQIIQLML